MKETTKILNDSPWGQTELETKQAEGGPAAITNTGSSRTMVPRDASKDSPGAITSYIKYYIRLLTAKPVRQAVVRRLILDSPEMDAQRKEQLKSFADATTPDFIVVAVVAEAKDQSMGGQALQAFKAATLDSLKDSTYLERRDGQKVLLADFKAPVADGLGAKFVFPRLLNNQQFLEPGDGQLKFYCQLIKAIRLEARFRVSDMMYYGRLEYDTATFDSLSTDYADCSRVVIVRKMEGGECASITRRHVMDLSGVPYYKSSGSLEALNVRRIGESTYECVLTLNRSWPINLGITTHET